MIHPILNAGIESPRCHLKTLSAEDVGDAYLSWFTDPVVNRFIVATRKPQTLDTLRHYAREMSASAENLVIAIFEKSSRRHIGNMRFAHMNNNSHQTIVSVLIGDAAWRGRGIFQEAFQSVASFLSREYGIREYWLAVESENTAARKAYQKSGFHEEKPAPSLFPSPETDFIYMRCPADVAAKVSLSS